MGTVELIPQRLEDIEVLYCGTVYPRFSKETHKTALCLFSARWHGRQDVYWLSRAGVRGVCVDLDSDRLGEMAAVYPAGWEFVTADAYEFAEAAWLKGEKWDVVTLDPWTSQFARCAELLPMWCGLANKTVVLGHGWYRLEDPEAPEGWQMTDKIRRSDYKGGVNWLVFERG